uniref:Reverse transcriptase domain-containing protein n=1 Tax=Tanacetum cinerariifolium TaxID=118510 RepID=A0A699GSS3_TANCI|nr:hypothetical protein [Tanacetum cinerariifolium]
MSKVLQGKGIESLPNSTEPNPKDHVKSISTAKADSFVIRHIGSGPYVVSDTQYINLSSETVPFPNRLHGYCCHDWNEAHFVILDIPEDDDVPLILGRPFLSTAHAKIDVFKWKITLKVGEEKLVFKSIKPATNIIRKVYMVKERTDLGSKTEFVGEAINKSFDLLYGFSITDDMDITSSVVLGVPFCKKFASFKKIMERFAHGDKREGMDEE